MMKYRKTLALSTLFVVCGLLLVGCNGGGGSSDTGNGTTVNGNAIPPRPDATANNATIKGIDVNNNGLRDDVEILVAWLSNSTTYSGSAFRIAQIKNKLATEDIATQDEYINLINEQICLNRNRTQEERDILSMDDIRYAINNTKARSAMSYANDNKYSNALTGATTCN